MTTEYSRIACGSEGRRSASNKRRNMTGCQHVVHTLRPANVNLEGLRRRALWRAVTKRAQSVKDRPQEDLLAAPSMTPPGYRHAETGASC